MDRDTAVIFTVNEQSYGLPLDKVERIIRMVEIILLPKTPNNLLGVINMHGQIIPVLNIRQCFGLPSRNLSIKDYLIIAYSAQIPVALVAETIGLIKLNKQTFTLPSDILAGAEYIEDFVKTDSGLIMMINDLGRFLPQENFVSSEVPHD